jgi:hypothetical protein
MDLPDRAQVIAEVPGDSNPAMPWMPGRPGRPGRPGILVKLLLWV